MLLVAVCQIVNIRKSYASPLERRIVSLAEVGLPIGRGPAGWVLAAPASPVGFTTWPTFAPFRRLIAARVLASFSAPMQLAQRHSALAPTGAPRHATPLASSVAFAKVGAPRGEFVTSLKKAPAPSPVRHAVSGAVVDSFGTSGSLATAPASVGHAERPTTNSSLWAPLAILFELALFYPTVLLAE
mmetsp:Transcript_39588/g.54975  ORF Transcript_39588/g.54975 Transcript_39588/m.54975 type:complete len:186 (-) Transcript_39588:735-1292(-)